MAFLSTLLVSAITAGCLGIAWSCFGVPKGICQLMNRNHLVCDNAFPITFPSNLSTIPSIVTLCSWPLQTLDAGRELARFSHIRQLTVTRSYVRSLLPLSHLLSLEMVRLVHLQLVHLECDTFRGLQNLHTIDLRHNRLTFLDERTFTSLPSLTSIHLSGNNWTCDPELGWIVSEEKGSAGKKVADKDQLWCEGKSKSKPKPLIAVMNIIKVMKGECPAICQCSLEHVVWAHTPLVDIRGMLLPRIAVNCSRRGLVAMPDRLPRYTSALHLSHNNLTSVEALAYNDNVSHVKDVYLDHNNILTIDVLEGTSWLNHFGVFSLKANNLRQIPLYVLGHAFDNNKDSLVRVYLADNPWHCDCQFASHFKNFLIKYAELIKDHQEIRCNMAKDDKNSNKKIIELDIRDLCESPQTIKLTFIDKLNIFLAAMIFLVISTFLYNLTVYKTTGKLPWMVDKLV